MGFKTADFVGHQTSFRIAPDRKDRIDASQKAQKTIETRKTRERGKEGRKGGGGGRGQPQLNTYTVHISVDCCFVLG